MKIKQTSDKYLNILYLKSKNDIRKGYSDKIIAKLLGLTEIEAQNVKKYLYDKTLLDRKIYYSGNIIISSEGIDYIEELRKNRIFKTIKFKNLKYLSSPRDAIEFLYYYVINDEEGKSEAKTIEVSISGDLCIDWGIQIWSLQPDKEYSTLAKILLQFAKDKIIEKLKEGTLNEHEVLILLPTTHPSTSPYNPDNLIDLKYAEYEIEVGQSTLHEEIKENKLAASIIEVRDRINVIFHEKYKEKLLLLNEERNLRDFFKSAKTEEEFSHRVASLGQVSRYMNVSILRKLTNETNTKIGSIALLKIFLQSRGKLNKTIIDTFIQIGRIRQGYPIHTDTAGVVKGYKYFGLQYPIEDFESSWTTILNQYLTSLKQLYEILLEIYLIKEE